MKLVKGIHYDHSGTMPLRIEYCWRHRDATLDTIRLGTAWLHGAGWCRYCNRPVESYEHRRARLDQRSPAQGNLSPSEALCLKMWPGPSQLRQGYLSRKALPGNLYIWRNLEREKYLHRPGAASWWCRAVVTARGREALAKFCAWQAEQKLQKEAGE